MIFHHHFLTFPIHALRKSDNGAIGKIKEKTLTKIREQEKEEKIILCRNCKNKITTFKDIITVDGSHQHTFSNPEGIVFEIGCFSMADGCINYGTPTSEFTWFSGYNWRFSFCSRCQIHLGWFYQGRDKQSFYGLILMHLAES